MLVPPDKTIDDLKLEIEKVANLPKDDIRRKICAQHFKDFFDTYIKGYDVDSEDLYKSQNYIAEIFSSPSLITQASTAYHEDLKRTKRLDNGATKSPVSSKDKIVIAITGLPGAGKSRISEKYMTDYPNAVFIEPDKSLEYHPFVDILKEVGGSDWASLGTYLSRNISKDTTDKLCKENYQVIGEGTVIFDFYSEVAEQHEGYTCDLHQILTPPVISERQNGSRAIAIAESGAAVRLNSKLSYENETTGLYVHHLRLIEQYMSKGNSVTLHTRDANNNTRTIVANTFSEYLQYYKTLFENVDLTLEGNYLGQEYGLSIPTPRTHISNAFGGEKDTLENERRVLQKRLDNIKDLDPEVRTAIREVIAYPEGPNNFSLRNNPDFSKAIYWSEDDDLLSQSDTSEDLERSLEIACQNCEEVTLADVSPKMTLIEKRNLAILQRKMAKIPDLETAIINDIQAIDQDISEIRERLYNSLSRHQDQSTDMDNCCLPGIKQAYFNRLMNKLSSKLKTVSSHINQLKSILTNLDYLPVSNQQKEEIEELLNFEIRNLEALKDHSSRNLATLINICLEIFKGKPNLTQEITKLSVSNYEPAFAGDRMFDPLMKEDVMDLQKKVLQGIKHHKICDHTLATAMGSGDVQITRTQLTMNNGVKQQKTTARRQKSIS